jgi:hypothetical protein
VLREFGRTSYGAKMDANERRMSESTGSRRGLFAEWRQFVQERDGGDLIRIDILWMVGLAYTRRGIVGAQQ